MATSCLFPKGAGRAQKMLHLHLGATLAISYGILWYILRTKYFLPSWSFKVIPIKGERILIKGTFLFLNILSKLLCNHVLT